MEIQSVNVVRDLLGSVPGLAVNLFKCSPKENLGNVGLVGFTYRKMAVMLVVEELSNGAPRFVRSRLAQLEASLARMRRSEMMSTDQHLIPLLVSPYLPPESRAICEDHKVAYLDLYGNAKLVFDSVYIERSVAGKPASEIRALRSIYSPKAAAILRVLLRKPDRHWRVADLATEAKASLGHVSNVRKALLEREWVEIRKCGIVLTQADVLLRHWRENYRSPVGKTITGYTHLHGKQLDEQLRGVLNSNSERPRAIYSLHSAAFWLAPFGRTATQTFHVDEPGAEAVKAALELSRPTKGANVAMQVLAENSRFEGTVEPVPGVVCTDPIVTYLDLWNGNDRDREAAEYLAEECFPWLK